MRLIVFFITAAFLQVHASGLAQNVSFAGNNLSIDEVFDAVKTQTGYQVLYADHIIKLAKPVTIKASSLPLGEFLDELFKTQPSLKYSIKAKTIFVVEKPAQLVDLFQVEQTPVIIRVLDENRNPLSGATIFNTNTKRSKITDNNGVAAIEGAINDVIQISYVGFTAQSYTVKNLSAAVTITLKSNAVLDEAVVYNGYQKIKQKYLTGSVTSLRMDSIFQPGLTTVDKMLEGRVPGMTYMQNSGQSGAAPKLRIRGTNTYLGTREPIWVVDGIVRTNPFPIAPERLNDPDFVNLLGNAISGLNPYDIEQIDVLKDATASALYGVRAANGVIVITTKRGKAGPPTLNYNVTSTYTRRPRYTDRSIYMMNSAERIDVSRELIEKKILLRGTAIEAYEKAIMSYNAGEIDHETFKSLVGKAETVNTDWLGETMRDVIATNHTLSISGGNATSAYRASVGYRNEPGVIKKEANDLYTGSLNMQLNYKKFKVDFNVQLSKNRKRYTPNEIGVLNYAYGTSRAISAYNDDGSSYYYPTISSSQYNMSGNSLKTMNIFNEMGQTGESIESNEYTASIDLSYEIVKGLQFQTRMAYTGGDAKQETFFTEKTEWATQLRYTAYRSQEGIFDPSQDPMPFGGELRQSFVRRNNYLINGRLSFSRFLDPGKRHQVNTEIAADVMSNRTNNFSGISRGYYPGRGHSFAQIDLSKHLAYASWLSNAGLPVIAEQLQNSLRPYATATYIFNDKYVISASTSQEFSNSFGNRSNEKFLPTWAVSGRWNIHEDLLKNAAWVDRMAVLVSMGTRGNMITTQSPYAVITKGAMNTFYNYLGSKLKNFPNPDLAWEKTQDYNASIQFSVLKGRINGSLGYFYSKTTNAFLSQQVSSVNGAPGNRYIINGGTLENQGVELALNFKIIDNAGGSKNGFMWRFDPQLGQVFNRLINNNINSKNVLVDVASINMANYLDGSVPVNGKSVNTFFSYQFKGLDPQKGYPIFYGAEPANKAALIAKYNAMTKDQVFEAVFVESGRREPVLQGSFNNSFSYRAWTLNVTFSYSVGNKIRLLKIASGNYGTYRPSSQQNLRKEFVNRWRYPGDEQFTNIPGISGADYTNSDDYAWWLGASPSLVTGFAENYYQMYDNSDIRVVKGDYLKLQYVSLSYRLPDELCNKISAKGGFVSINGTNLFIIANKALRGQDPSQSGTAANINLSIRPVYALNINLSF